MIGKIGLILSAIGAIIVCLFLISPAQDDQDARVLFRFQDMSRVHTPDMTLSIVFTDGDSENEISGRVNSSSDTASIYPTSRLPTANAGSLMVHFTLLAPTDDTISTGNAAIPLKPDWIWEITYYVAPYNPIYGCWGCFGSSAFAMDSAYQDTIADSVFLVWGGNSISHPVIY